MMFRTLCLATSFLTLTGDGPRASQAKSDAEKLQGKWKIVAAEFEGRPATQAYRPGTVIMIERDELYFTDGFAKSAPSKFKLDASTKPKAIDIGDGKKSMAGIYLLDGDSLKLCSCLEGPRPKDFVTKAGDKTNLLTLTREKP